MLAIPTQSVQSRVSNRYTNAAACWQFLVNMHNHVGNLYVESTCSRCREMFVFFM